MNGQTNDIAVRGSLKSAILTRHDLLIAICMLARRSSFPKSGPWPFADPGLATFPLKTNDDVVVLCYCKCPSGRPKGRELWVRLSLGSRRKTQERVDGQVVMHKRVFDIYIMYADYRRPSKHHLQANSQTWSRMMRTLAASATPFSASMASMPKCAARDAESLCRWWWWSVLWLARSNEL